MPGDEFSFSDLQEQQRAFVREREWEPFHTPKNLAMALAGEAGELLEIFQWLTPEESQRIMEQPQAAESVQHELADIIFYCARLADVLGIDIKRAVAAKMLHNSAKYPVEKARGNAKKYTDF